MRILLVDNDYFVRNIIGNMLTALGYVVMIARDGYEALEIFNADHDFDLVLTDINMPLMDGWQLSRHLNGISPHIPIVAITGENQNSIDARLQGSPIRHALFKPIGLSTLKDTLENVLHLGDLG